MDWSQNTRESSHVTDRRNKDTWLRLLLGYRDWASDGEDKNQELFTIPRQVNIPHGMFPPYDPNNGIARGPESIDSLLNETTIPMTNPNITTIPKNQMDIMKFLGTNQ